MLLATLSVCTLTGCAGGWSVKEVTPVPGIGQLYESQLTPSTLPSMEDEHIMADESVPREFEGPTWQEYRERYGLKTPTFTSGSQQTIEALEQVEQLDGSKLLNTLAIEDPTVCSDNCSYLLLKGDWFKLDDTDSVPAYVNTKAAALNFRKGPSTGNEIIDSFAPNTTVYVMRSAHMSDGSTWYYVRTEDGRFGWQHSYYLNIKPDAVKKAANVVVPTPDTVIITTEAVVPICDFTGKKEAVAYLEVLESDEGSDLFNRAYIQKNAIFWSGATTGSSKIANLKAGQEVSIHGKVLMNDNSIYYFVSTQLGNEIVTGFVSNKYVDINNPLTDEVILPTEQNRLIYLFGEAYIREFFEKANTKTNTFLTYTGSEKKYEGYYRVVEAGKKGKAKREATLVSSNTPKPGQIPTRIHIDSEMEELPVISAKGTAIKYGNDNLSGVLYTDIKESFKSLGFKNVICESVIDISGKQTEGTVESIVVADKAVKSGDVLAADAKIVIRRWVKQLPAIEDVQFNETTIREHSDELIGKDFLAKVEAAHSQHFEHNYNGKRQHVDKIRTDIGTILVYGAKQEDAIDNEYTGWMQMTYIGISNDNTSKESYLMFKDATYVTKEEEKALKAVYSPATQFADYNSIRNAIDQYVGQPHLIYALPNGEPEEIDGQFVYTLTSCYSYIDTAKNQVIYKPNANNKYIVKVDKRMEELEQVKGVYVYGTLANLADTSKEKELPVLLNIKLLDPLSTKQVYQLD